MSGTNVPRRTLGFKTSCNAKMAALPVSGARGASCLSGYVRRRMAVRGTGRRGGLSHVVGYKGTVESGGGFGELGWCQLEKSGGGADELGGDVASAAGAAHVVEGLFDGGHVDFLGGQK